MDPRCGAGVAAGVDAAALDAGLGRIASPNLLAPGRVVGRATQHHRIVRASVSTGLKLITWLAPTTPPPNAAA